MGSVVVKGVVVTVLVIVMRVGVVEVVVVVDSVGDFLEYRIEYSILSNSKFSNSADI